MSEPARNERGAGAEESARAEGSQSPASYATLESQLTHVFMEESPRLPPAAQALQLAQLHARAAQKRQALRTGPGFDLGWLLHAVPRWAQVAAVAIIVVLLANGITEASASSLPGSLLYPVKRLAEQSNIWLSPTAGERAQVWMNLASIRLDEAQRLLNSGQRIDPAILDAIDQSIFNALAEITNTRGAERLGLLKRITQLSAQQQQVLDELAPRALPNDRPRFEQTSRLLGGVATLAGAAESNSGLPLLPTLTPAPTETPTAKPTWTGTPVPTNTETATPAPATTAVESQPTLADSVSKPNPEEGNPQVQPTEATDSKEKDTPQPPSTEKPEAENSSTPAPQKSETPEPKATEPPDTHQSETPSHQGTRTEESHVPGTPVPPTPASASLTGDN